MKDSDHQERAMAEDLLDHFKETMKRLLRPDAVIKTDIEPDGSYVVTAGWRLGTHRMDNWSKDIYLRISPAVVERYGKLNEIGRVKADANLVSYIKLKLLTFQPDHDKPRFLLPPVEVWVVEFDDVFPRQPPVPPVVTK
jgi:hypothetical protein